MIAETIKTRNRPQTFYGPEVFTDEIDYTIVEQPQQPLETLPMAVQSIARQALRCIGVSIVAGVVTFAPSLASDSVAATITAISTPPDSVVSRGARVRQKLNALPERLEQMGWNSQLVVPTRETLDHAADVFTALVMPTLPDPDIVPTPNGGVQFEWHTTVFDMEVDVSGPREVDVYLVNAKTGERFDFVDLETTLALQPVKKALKTIL